MTSRHNTGVVAARTLAGIRLANGILGLLAPRLLLRRLGVDPGRDESAIYPFRLFGIRNIVLGVDLLTTRDAEFRRAAATSVIVHATDLASVVSGGLRGSIPPVPARLVTILSGINTALALVSWCVARQEAPTGRQGSAPITG